MCQLSIAKISLANKHSQAPQQVYDNFTWMYIMYDLVTDYAQ